ncbi:aldehyde dehydrogenase family protein [Lyngbya aestuarii]|uniref:aldehyde dehydrogenase family protein n=1 Tax=Lyngbya aestuarii TaxID=118322 RepID=UPI00403D6786
MQDGATIGNMLSSNPADLDYVCFTVSDLAGAKVGTNAADTVKEIALELSGKSPIIILRDADI